MTPCRSLLFLITGAVALLCAGAQAQVGVLSKNDTRLSDASDPKFHVGDVWEYKTRSGEENSRLTVVKIDSSPELGIIVHIAVDHLIWKDCQNKPFAQSVPHMPFARKALEVGLSKQTGVYSRCPTTDTDTKSGRPPILKSVQAFTSSKFVTRSRSPSPHIGQASGAIRKRPGKQHQDSCRNIPISLTDPTKGRTDGANLC
jgi:hypothetical protein